MTVEKKIEVRKLSQVGDRDMFLSDLAFFWQRISVQNPISQTISNDTLKSMLTAPLCSYCEFFMVTLEGEVVGSIGVFSPVDTEKDFGLFGFLEIDLSCTEEAKVALYLTNCAKDYLSSIGKIRMMGPVCFNIWLPYRYRLDFFDETHLWEPSQPRKYLDLLRDNDFTISHRYRSEFVDLTPAFEKKYQTDYLSILEAGYSFKSFDEVDLYGEYLETLYQMSLKGFENSSEVYEPISFDVFKYLYMSFIDRSQLKYSFFCFNKLNEAVGFMYTFLDDSDGVKTAVFKTISINNDYRGLRMSNALYYKCLESQLKDGVTRVCSALMKEDVISSSFTRNEKKKTVHSYAIFEKRLIV